MFCYVLLYLDTWIFGEYCDSVSFVKKIFFFHVKQPRQMLWKRPSHKNVQNSDEDFEELLTISISMEVVEPIPHSRWMWWGSVFRYLFLFSPPSYLKVLIIGVVMYLMMFWCFPSLRLGLLVYWPCWMKSVGSQKQQTKALWKKLYKSKAPTPNFRSQSSWKTKLTSVSYIMLAR